LSFLRDAVKSEGIGDDFMKVFTLSSQHGLDAFLNHFVLIITDFSVLTSLAFFSVDR
jgi:hypothetical protein